MEKDKIGMLASNATREEFSDELARHIRLTKEEIDALFPSQSDREELATLVGVVLSAADENERKARLIGNIGKVAGAVTKLLDRV
jgi:hypothetical protein